MQYFEYSLFTLIELGGKSAGLCSFFYLLILTNLRVVNAFFFDANPRNIIDVFALLKILGIYSDEHELAVGTFLKD